MHRICLLALLLVAALALPAADALACSCAGPAKGEKRAFYREALKDSDGAVVARVQKLRTTDPDPAVLGDEEAVYTLRVRRAFKHLRQFPTGRVLRIRTSASGSLCGLEMREGGSTGSSSIATMKAASSRPRSVPE